MSCANRITYICSLNIRRIIITWTDNSDRYIVSITGFIILCLHGGVARSAGVLVQCVDNNKQLDANDYKHKVYWQLARITVLIILNSLVKISELVITKNKKFLYFQYIQIELLYCIIYQHAVLK